jgi:hypothetical protein
MLARPRYYPPLHSWMGVSGMQLFLKAGLRHTERLAACIGTGVGLIGTVAFCSRTEEPGEQRFCHHQRLNSQWDCLFPSGPTLIPPLSSNHQPSTIQLVLY